MHAVQGLSEMGMGPHIVLVFILRLPHYPGMQSSLRGNPWA